MTLTWECAAYQIVGGREEQEDYCAYRPFDNSLLCVVADGMGGHAAGATAARLAVDRFLESTQGGPPPRSNSFINALNDANSAIASHIEANPETEGMGCTLVGVDLDSEGFRWISVGDSKLFHHFANRLEQVNADHSMASRLQIAVKNGDMTAEEAAISPSRHILLSALTGEAIAKVDFSLKGRTTSLGDLVILASDGLDTLAMGEIETILADHRQAGIDQLCQALVEAVAARHNPRQDNTTVMIARAIEARSVDPDDVPTRPVRNGY